MLCDGKSLLSRRSTRPPEATGFQISATYLPSSSPSPARLICCAGYIVPTSPILDAVVDIIEIRAHIQIARGEAGEAHRRSAEILRKHGATK